VNYWMEKWKDGWMDDLINQLIDDIEEFILNHLLSLFRILKYGWKIVIEQNHNKLSLDTLFFIDWIVEWANHVDIT